MDLFGIFSTMKDVQRSWEERPLELARKQTDLLLRLQEATTEELRQLLIPGDPAPGEEPRSLDLLEALKSGAQMARRHHAIYQDWLQTLIGGAPGLQEKQRERMLFWARQLINGMSPSNYFWTNYSAVKRFMDSNGKSLAKGLQS